MRTTALVPWRELAPLLATLTALGALTACGPETTPSWDLVHDRIVAVRASAPGLAPGSSATIDVLVTSETGGPAEVAPLLVSVVPTTPATLAGAVGPSGQVTAPDAAALAEARIALGLVAGAPVPLGLVVTVAIGDQVFVAVKTVWLGADVANPAIDAVRINGAAAIDAAAAAAVGESELAIDAATDDEIAWLTSIGELEDEQDLIAHLTVEAPIDGQIVVVRRDRRGGVAWRVVALRVQ